MRLLLFIISVMMATGCSTKRINLSDDYANGCIDAVYNYILMKDRLDEPSNPDQVYAINYCKMLKQRKEAKNEAK
jgi:hypothetical protein